MHKIGSFLLSTVLHLCYDDNSDSTWSLFYSPVLRAIVANNKSAQKRIEISERNRLRNKSYKSAVKTLMKKTIQSVDTYTASPSEEQLETVKANLSAAYSKIDKAVKRNVLHRNTGARRKASLAKAVKKVEAVS